MSSATDTSHDSQSFPEARLAVIHDLESVDIVPLSTLFNHVLPVVRTDEVDRIVAALEQSGALDSDGWECFKGKNGAAKSSEVPPFHQRTNIDRHWRDMEGDIFLGFEDIYKAIMAAEAEGNDSFQPTLSLLVHGNENTTTDRASYTRPDATLHLRESSVPFISRIGERYHVDHADVATYFQWKRKDTDENYEADRTRLVHNVYYRFRSDPCVTHVTGITIENTTTRFWYFDRSVILESRPFDFMTEPRHLIHIFLALNRGSRSELGFDSTIRCVGYDTAIKDVSASHFQEHHERQYEFEVHDNHDDQNDDSLDRRRTRKYRSTRCIANYGMIGIRGRGTFVYAVQPSEDKDAPLQVLKDSWINIGRTTEGKVLEEIHTTLQSDPEYRPYLQHLLKPDCYGYVPNETGIRMETVSRAQHVNASSSLQSPGMSSVKRKLDSIRGVGSQAKEEVLSAKSGPRGDSQKRCRTVFVKGPGKELGDLETLGKVFNAIKGGLTAILAMYRAGYIHRDLSAGNIVLFSRKNNQSGQVQDVGVLIDLEYAKKFPDATQPPDGRPFRGTWEFVASEVRIERYLYSWCSNPEKTVPWFRNPVHDIESCWLVACWSFFHFKHPTLLSKEMEDKAILFGPLRPLIGTADLPLGRLPRDILPEIYAWAESIGKEYRKLQLDREDREKLASFDYTPIIRNAIAHVDSMLRISMKNHSTSWHLHSRQPDVDTRPTKRVKIEEPGPSGT